MTPKKQSVKQALLAKILPVLKKLTSSPWFWVGAAVALVSLAMYFRGCDTVDNYLDDMQQSIVDRAAGAREEYQRKIDALESSLFELQEQIDSLQEQIQASIHEREENHDAINNARTIRDIDAILRRGRSANAGPNPSAGRTDSNPYK